MKHILKFKDLFESTSAASQERAGWDYPPFKFAKNFDPRLGYSKSDFTKDLVEIYKESKADKRKGLMDTIFKSTGVMKISQVENLQNSQVDKLMREIESFLESQAAEKLKILPDGFVLCYENLRDPEGERVDIYYSPVSQRVRVSYTGTYPETRDEEFSLDKCDDEKGEL